VSAFGREVVTTIAIEGGSPPGATEAQWPAAPASPSSATSRLFAAASCCRRSSFSAISDVRERNCRTTNPTRTPSIAAEYQEERPLELGSARFQKVARTGPQGKKVPDITNWFQLERLIRTIDGTRWSSAFLSFHTETGVEGEGFHRQFLLFGGSDDRFVVQDTTREPWRVLCGSVDSMAPVRVSCLGRNIVVLESHVVVLAEVVDAFETVFRGWAPSNEWEELAEGCEYACTR